MRQPDINRVKRAKEHLKAAKTILDNIKWENVNGMEDLCIMQTLTEIDSADASLNSVLFMQDKEK